MPSNVPQATVTTNRSVRPFVGICAILFSALIVLYSSASSRRGESGLLVERTVETLESALAVNSSGIQLVSRQTYQCSASNPCSNGACCGKSGYCGYGPTYCGSGCVSNCNAVAQCGQYASPAGTKCPLNVCCSQYGFCGTTDDFCGTGCQSNCVLNPSPPSGSSGGVNGVFSRVIGYYESWSDTLSCHKMAPSDLPLTALTHLNYAFAYISPGTFEVTPMDSSTPPTLYQDTTSAKMYNSNLKVFISIGGWTFSDNGTSTQPLFGEIASSAANRQTFANNVLRFLGEFGFDGVDLDWEYPGTGDRGGTPADTANYVLLLQTLQSTFAASGHNYGLTFTAPSSYWYLQWFDLPNMLKYADWVNFMTYDLHGVWDATDPYIGSIVQSHTNLTEIKLAVDLLWRVGVNPSQVSMGFGFYGRSFTLSDPSCTTPGCPFNGGANPGPCSATAGILDWYEISALLTQNPSLQPVHDQAAAAMYVVYGSGKNQWVSYDNAETFAQKTQWANSVGLGGALIWASDTDDSQYSAHKALLGTSFGHVNTGSSSNPFAATDASVSQNLAAQSLQNCYTDSCTPTRANYGCHTGYRVVGNEDDCSYLAGYRRNICCPDIIGNCRWRGNPPNCNGQCQQGEILYLLSTVGGGPRADIQSIGYCSRGNYAFCCDGPDLSDITSGCRWTGCGDGCNSDEENLGIRIDYDGCPAIYAPGVDRQYCCKKPSALSSCTFRGDDYSCVNNQCHVGEVLIGSFIQGDEYPQCQPGGPKKSFCCTASPPQPPPQPSCNLDLCQDVEDCTDPDSEPNNVEPSIFRREASHERSISKRQGFNKPRGGDPRDYRVDLFNALGQIIAAFVIQSLRYPTAGQLAQGPRQSQVSHLYWYSPPGNCVNINVITQDLSGSNGMVPSPLPPGISGTAQTEHTLDLSVHAQFITALTRGRLPSGAQTNTPPLDYLTLQRAYNNPTGLPPNLQRVSTGSPDLRRPADRVFEAFGSMTNPGNLILVQDRINNMKSLVFGLVTPLMIDSDEESIQTYRRYVESAVAGNSLNEQRMLQYLRDVLATFNYINNPEVLRRLNMVIGDIRQQLQIIETNAIGFNGITAMWDEFMPDFFMTVVRNSRQWLTEAINEVLRAYTGNDPAQEAIRILVSTYQGELNSIIRINGWFQ